MPNIDVDLHGAFRDKNAPTFKTVRSTGINVGKHREYVWKGMIAPEDFVMLMGAPGSGNSVLAPFVAHCVSRGVMCLGRRTTKTPVLYIAGEGGYDLQERVQALNMEYGDAPDLHILAADIDLRSEAHRNGLSKVIREIQPGFIAMDTMASCFPGLEENDSSSMSLAVQAQRGLTYICGSALMTIHHTPKSGDTPRGHSILNGNLDMTMRLENEAGVRRAILGKNRNGPCEGANIQFQIGVVSLGEDQDGDKIDKPILRSIDAAVSAIPETGMTNGERDALSFLYDVISLKGFQLDNRPGMPGYRFNGCYLKDWEAECASRGLTIDPDEEAKRKVFVRAADRLRRSKRIAVNEGIVWATRQQSQTEQ